MGIETRARKRGLLAGLALAATISTGSSAFAQCVGAVTGPGAAFFGGQFAAIAAAGGAASGAFSGALGNIGTAFLTQQGSAFVSAPNDPRPDQPGGGVWMRGVGGEVTNKFTSTATGNVNAGALNPAFGADANFNCSGSVRQTFSGAQVGQDISRLNWGGWNVHLGTTAGYLHSHATDSNGGTTDFDVPFVGGYAVATYGRFFADVMVREEFYNTNLTNTAVGLFDQQVGARGTSVSASAGYNFALANNWFIEPSAGFIWSRTNVDSFAVSGGTIGNGIVSIYQTSPIESQIGRLSLRGGTTSDLRQHDLAAVRFRQRLPRICRQCHVDDHQRQRIHECVGTAGAPVPLTGTNSTNRVGTYGQYSVGVAGQVANTGWLGFVRADYRNGDRIDGWTGNAGIRYQFTPEMIASIDAHQGAGQGARRRRSRPPTGPASMSVASSARNSARPISALLAT